MLKFILILAVILVAAPTEADARIGGFSRRKCERGDLERCQRLCDQGRTKYCGRTGPTR